MSRAKIVAGLALALLSSTVVACGGNTEERISDRISAGEGQRWTDGGVDLPNDAGHETDGSDRNDGTVGNSAATIHVSLMLAGGGDPLIADVNPDGVLGDITVRKYPSSFAGTLQYKTVPADYLAGLGPSFCNNVRELANDAVRGDSFGPELLDLVRGIDELPFALDFAPSLIESEITQVVGQAATAMGSRALAFNLTNPLTITSVSITLSSSPDAISNIIGGIADITKTANNVLNGELAMATAYGSMFWPTGVSDLVCDLASGAVTMTVSWTAEASGLQPFRSQAVMSRLVGPN